MLISPLTKATTTSARARKAESSSAGQSAEPTDQQKIVAPPAGPTSNKAAEQPKATKGTPLRPQEKKHSKKGRFPLKDVKELPQITGKGKETKAGYTATQYDPNVGFEAYEFHEDKSFDWKTLLAPQEDAVYDIPALLREEQVAIQDDTIFGKALAEHMGLRGHEAIRRSSFNLPAFLRVLRNDHTQAKGAWIYVNASRGLDLIDPDVQVKHSVSENYASATCPVNGYPDEVEKDIERLHKNEYVLPWKELAAEIGSTKETPTITHSLGAVMRGQRVRIVIDASRGQHEESINDLMQTQGKTCFASIGQAKLAMAQRGSCARADLVDAFLQTPLSARSCELCGFKWKNKQGVETWWGYRSLGFGFALGPYWQQCLAVACMRATVMQCAEAGCIVTDLAQYDQHQKVATPARRGHQLTAVLALLDDFAFFATSKKMTHFAWVRFLHITGQMGIVVSPKPGKTDPPCTSMIYLGIEINLRNMTVKLHEERVVAMRERLTELHEQTEVSKKQLQSIIGVLVFATCVIRCGRAAYSHLLQLLRGAKRPSHSRRGKIKLDAAARGDIKMWLQLLTRVNSKSVISGVRMPLVKWQIYTDASYTGWAWTAGFGAMDYGVWPESWAERMGQSRFACIWICELEILTVAFALRRVAPLAANAKITVHCDNMPVVMMLKKHSSASERCCAVVAEIEWALATYNVELNPVHCRTYDNVVADQASRVYEPGFDIETFNSVVNEWKKECKQRCPTAPKECAMVRPDLLDLWQEHIVQMDLWQDAPAGGKDKAELVRLLPEYLRASKEHEAWSCVGKEPARARVKEMREQQREHTRLKRSRLKHQPSAPSSEIGARVHSIKSSSQAHTLAKHDEAVAATLSDNHFTSDIVREQTMAVLPNMDAATANDKTVAQRHGALRRGLRKDHRSQARGRAAGLTAAEPTAGDNGSSEAEAARAPVTANQVRRSPAAVDKKLQKEKNFQEPTFKRKLAKFESEAPKQVAECEGTEKLAVRIARRAKFKQGAKDSRKAGDRGLLDRGSQGEATL